MATTKEDKVIKKTGSHKDLIKSIQELSLTLKSLKILACDLKNKSELASAKLDQNTIKPLSTTTDNHTDPYKTLH